MSIPIQYYHTQIHSATSSSSIAQTESLYALNQSITECSPGKISADTRQAAAVVQVPPVSTISSTRQQYPASTFTPELLVEGGPAMAICSYGSQAEALHSSNMKATNTPNARRVNAANLIAIQRSLLATAEGNPPPSKEFQEMKVAEILSKAVAYSYIPQGHTFTIPVITSNNSVVNVEYSIHALNLHLGHPAYVLEPINNGGVKAPPYVTIRGTNPSEINSLYTAGNAAAAGEYGEVGIDVVNKSKEMLQELFRALAIKHKKKPILTGHSQGATISSMISLHCHRQLQQTYAFNCPSFTQNTQNRWLKLMDQPTYNASSLTIINTIGDALNKGAVGAGRHIGVLLKCEGPSGLSGAKLHGISVLQQQPLLIHREQTVKPLSLVRQVSHRIFQSLRYALTSVTTELIFATVMLIDHGKVVVGRKESGETQNLKADQVFKSSNNGHSFQATLTSAFKVYTSQSRQLHASRQDLKSMHQKIAKTTNDLNRISSKQMELKAKLHAPSKEVQAPTLEELKKLQDKKSDLTQQHEKLQAQLKTQSEHIEQMNQKNQELWKKIQNLSTEYNRIWIHE